MLHRLKVHVFFLDAVVNQFHFASRYSILALVRINEIWQIVAYNAQYLSTSAAVQRWLFLDWDVVSLKSGELIQRGS